MNKLLIGLEKKLLKQDARKLGINLLSASLAGGFITHITDMTILSSLSLLWLGSIGIAFTLFGLYR